MLSTRARRPLEVEFPAHGVWAGESRHGRGFVMPETRHAFLKIVHPIAGRGWLERSGARAPLTPGDVVVVPAGCRHRLVDAPRSPLSLYVVAVRADLWAALPGAAEGFAAGYRHWSRPVWGAEVREAIRALLHEQALGGPGAAALGLGAAWTVIGRVWRMGSLRGQPLAATGGSAGQDPARARVAAYAEALAESFVRARGLDEAAAELGLSRRRFTELFREVTGGTWKQAVLRHRVAHARRLLLATDRSVLSIGYECGFGDVTSFHRAFRAETGLPPAGWRASREAARVNGPAR